jgi:hypothetical protein
MITPSFECLHQDHNHVVSGRTPYRVTVDGKLYWVRKGVTDAGVLAAMACRKELKPIRVAIRMPVRPPRDERICPGASSDASPIHGGYLDEGGESG